MSFLSYDFFFAWFIFITRFFMHLILRSERPCEPIICLCHNFCILYDLNVYSTKYSNMQYKITKLVSTRYYLLQITCGKSESAWKKCFNQKSKTINKTKSLLYWIFKINESFTCFFLHEMYIKIVICLKQKIILIAFCVCALFLAFKPKKSEKNGSRVYLVCW